VDPSDAFGDFLKSRRARITPSQAGLPAYGTNRRVPGLRREEVAMLAGISAEYYVRLERGSVRGVSEDVLDGLARALQLDDAERDHLFDLARATTTSTRRALRPPQERVRPSVQRILDVLVAAPAFVVNSRGEILAANVIGEALYSDLYAEPLRPVNTVRFIFLNPKAPEFFMDWDDVAEDAIGILRAQAGRDPYDRQLTDLIGELATRSDQFRVRWAAHEVRRHRTGTKRFHHPIVGDLSLDFESLDLPGDPGQKLVVYTAEPGSPSQQAIDLLASWVATPASHEDGTQANDALEADRPRKP
jgi:transcriptional regulator with XRE-family HTH domain